jgi:hypothetical protein
MEFPLLKPLVTSSLASVQLDYFLHFSLMSARSFDTLAVAGWAGPLLPSEPDKFAMTST